jgi:hypothetical protein
MSATDRKLAAQSVRAVRAMKTVSETERRLLAAGPDDIDVLEQVLESYEAANPFHAGHGDVPLKLRRAIRLLKKDTGQ